MKWCRVIALVLVGTAKLSAHSYYNLDFETLLRDHLYAWPTGTWNGYELTFDDAIAASGRLSYRIRSLTAPDSGLGPASIPLPAEQLRGKQVKISGSIKTQTVLAPGYAAIWLRVEGPQGILAFENMASRQVNGTKDWTRYEYELAIHPDATQIYLGVFLTGRGIAWFDNLTVEVDGHPLPQAPAPYVDVPTTAQKAWLIDNAIPLRTDQPGAGTADLEPLRALIGNARVVALGEATHGTAEFFRMKHRLIEFLASNLGFTVFAIEANMPEAYALNAYIIDGEGDPAKLLQGLYFWTWNTQEVLDMIEWMRDFNRSGRGLIQFTGFDMQTCTVASRHVQDFVFEASPDLYQEVVITYANISRAVSLPGASQASILAAAAAVKDIRLRLEANYLELVKIRPPADVDWAIQNARIVEQAAFFRVLGTPYRDEMMARNTLWILARNPGAKMVIWAHNCHVSRTPGAQGSYLAEALGAGYFPIGFAFSTGTYSGLSGGVLTSANVATTPYPGSIEYMFGETGQPRFLLDLRLPALDNPGAWLLSPMDGREIGVSAVDGFFSRPHITTDFDALIYIEKSTPSTLLPL